MTRLSDPVIVFCKSGKRASHVKQILEERGYQNVMNAGGFADVNSIFPIVPTPRKMGK